MRSSCCLVIAGASSEVGVFRGERGERAAEDPGTRNGVRRALWRRVTGVEASAALQEKVYFYKQAPDALLLNAAAMTAHFYTPAELAQAPSAAHLPGLKRTVPRGVWLETHGLDRCGGSVRLCAHAPCGASGAEGACACRNKAKRALKWSTARFSEHMCGDASAYAAWCESSEGEAAIRRAMAALADNIASMCVLRRWGHWCGVHVMYGASQACLQLARYDHILHARATYVLRVARALRADCEVPQLLQSAIHSEWRQPFA